MYSFHLLLLRILLYHFLPGIQMAYTLDPDPNNASTVTTMQGTPLRLSHNGVVGEANFVSTDTLASNGVWHSIDTLLIPVVKTHISNARTAVTLAPTSSLSNLLVLAMGIETLVDFVYAVLLVDLDETLTRSGATMTVLAPIHTAFETLPLTLYEPAWKLHLKALILHHIVPGDVVLTTTLPQNLPTMEGTDIHVSTENDGTMVLNGHAALVKPWNVPASNGVLYTIDNLLLPPWVTTTVAESAMSDTQLSQFVDLLHDHDLLGVLGMEGGYTLLAPVNAAFPRSLAFLKSLAMQDMVNVLSYHIIPQLVTSEQLMSGASFKTLQGTKVRIMSATILERTEIRINDASVIQSNVLANNGVLHYLDRVLIPVLHTASPVATLVDKKTQSPTTADDDVLETMIISKAVETKAKEAEEPV
jgi:transforming growth factor-beta-induced protein